MLKKLPDNFSFGLVFGVVTLALSYFLLGGVRLLFAGYDSNEFIPASPRIQLFSIVINIIIFRIVMLKLDKEKTGKGILFSTVVLALVYFFLHLRFNFQLIEVFSTFL